MEMIKFNYMLEIDISRNSSSRKLGVLRGAFEGFGCPKRHPDALLAKTMVKAKPNCTRIVNISMLCGSSRVITVVILRTDSMRLLHDRAVNMGQHLDHYDTNRCVLTCIDVNPCQNKQGNPR